MAPLTHTTPLLRAERLSRDLGVEVWIKQDGATHPAYGGNKVRKLDPLLAHARTRDATHVLTMGAAGSHHCLATSVHGAAMGFDVEVFLVPQPGSAHARETFAATARIASRVHPVSGTFSLAGALAARVIALRRRGARPYVIPVGGSTPRGALGYLDAMRELEAQRAAMGVAPFDAMVVALGSGGTLAGLVAGAAVYAPATRLVGVQVAGPMLSQPGWVRALARGALRLAGRDADRVAAVDLAVIRDAQGPGYAVPTADGIAARDRFAQDGFELDLTYTAKAAAGLVALARGPRAPRRVLFWQTLSVTHPTAPDADRLPAALDRLFVPPVG